MPIILPSKRQRWYWGDLCDLIQVQVPVRAKTIRVNNGLAIAHRAAEKRLQPRFAARVGLLLGGQSTWTCAQVVSDSRARSGRQISGLLGVADMVTKQKFSGLPGVDEQLVANFLS